VKRQRYASGERTTEARHRDGPQRASGAPEVVFRDSEERRRRVVGDRLFERSVIVVALFFSRRGAEPQRGLGCRRRSP
jgi:hypothetical protein